MILLPWTPDPLSHSHAPSSSSSHPHMKAGTHTLTRSHTRTHSHLNPISIMESPPREDCKSGRATCSDQATSSSSSTSRQGDQRWKAKEGERETRGHTMTLRLRDSLPDFPCHTLCDHDDDGIHVARLSGWGMRLDSLTRASPSLLLLLLLPWHPRRGSASQAALSPSRAASHGLVNSLPHLLPVAGVGVRVRVREKFNESCIRAREHGCTHPFFACTFISCARENARGKRQGCSSSPLSPPFTRRQRDSSCIPSLLRRETKNNSL